MKKAKVEILTIGTKSGECNIFLLFIDNELDYSIIIDSCFNKSFTLENVLEEALREELIKSPLHFDMICWTHPHEDHSNGMLDLLKNYSNKNTKFVIPVELSSSENHMKNVSTEVYNYLFGIQEDKDKNKKNKNEKFPGVIEYASASNKLIKRYFEKNIHFTIKALAPISNTIANIKRNNESSPNLNKYSITLLIKLEKKLNKDLIKKLVEESNTVSVMKLVTRLFKLTKKSTEELEKKLNEKFAKFSFLFTGDVENDTIEYFKTTGKNDKFNNILFLKIPHHGSFGSKELKSKFNYSTCENMICVTTTFNGSVLPKIEVLDNYLDLGDVYCTRNLQSKNTKNYGIVKSIFEFDFDGKNLKLKTSENPNPVCKTYGNAFMYGKKRTTPDNTKETTSSDKKS